MTKMKKELTVKAVCALSLLAVSATAGASSAVADDEKYKKSKAYLTDKYIPMIKEEVVGERGAPIFELGDDFLGTGRLQEPWVLPTGAVWNPSLWIFGGYRSAVQAVGNRTRGDYVEAVNRLDIIANLQLSGTERIVVGLTPMHEGGDFTRYVFQDSESERNEGGHSYFGAHLSTAFAEFEFAELFPNLDPMDKLGLDVGFAVGRQKIEFQDQFLVDDHIDSLGIVKNNLMIPGITNTRITGLWGWGQVHRGNNVVDEEAKLFGLFNSFDFPSTSMDLDLIYIDSDMDLANNNFGDSIHGAVAFSQRLGDWNTTARLMGSQGLDTDTDAANDGVLAYLETSRSFAGKPHMLYVNGFAGMGDFTSASRAGTAGGPVGRTGLAFSSRSLGAYGAALDNRGRDALGGAIGYQMFLNKFLEQMTFELAGVADTGGDDFSGVAASTRFSMKLNRRMLFHTGAYVANYEDDRDVGYGLRTELEVKF